jgi:pimeloyl-ACP methyl ester carboxylesterase
MWGADGGTPVFSLHGTPGGRHLDRRAVELGFEHMLCELGICLVTYDRPGYGGSDRHPGRTVADAAADVAAIADDLGIDRFAVEGTSSGAAHALAVAALLRQRVKRTACIAPVAPYDRLGPALWSFAQTADMRNLVDACRRGEEDAVRVIAEADRQARQATAWSEESPAPEILEWTRNGIWGWVDDALALVRPWGFEPSTVRVLTAIWHDPSDRVLPPQHSQWLHRRIRRSKLATSVSLGHGAFGDPRPDWRWVYAWLIGGRFTTHSGRASTTVPKRRSARAR